MEVVQPLSKPCAIDPESREGHPQAGQVALKALGQRLLHPIGFACLWPPGVAFSSAMKSGTQLNFHEYLQ